MRIGRRRYGQSSLDTVARGLVLAGTALLLPVARVWGQDGGGGEGVPDVEDMLVPSEVSFEADLDVSSWMTRAREFADAGEYETMAKLAQRILDADHPVPVDVGGQVHLSADVAAMALLRSLPPEGLETYRAWADPNARVLLARAEREGPSEALYREIASRYLLSSVGDQAAYRLACLHLTRGEYARARRWLTMLRTHCPDTDIAEEELLVRSAVADAGQGDVDSARALLTRIGGAADVGLNQESKLGAWLANLLAAREPGRRAVWPMPHGGPRRDGVPVTPDATDGDDPAGIPWVVEWAVAPDAAASGQSDVSGERALLLAAWGKGGAVPSDHLVGDGRRVYLSNAWGIRCLAPDGRSVWSSAGGAPFKALGSKLKRQFQTGGVGIRNFGRWTAFEDRVEGVASIVGDTVYRIEGSWRSGRRRPRPGGGKSAGGKSEDYFVRHGSHLAAYDSTTGRLRYRLGGGDSRQDGVLAGARFLNEPVRCGKHILVVCEQGDTLFQEDTLFLVAITEASGELAWKRELCSYAAPPPPPAAPVGILVSGGMAYLAPGQGVVLAVDGTTGKVLWGTTYEYLPESWRPINWGGRPDPGTAPPPAGWLENEVFLAGDTVVALPADAPYILAFDAKRGTPRYRAPTHGARRLVGLRDGTLVALGYDGLVAFDVEREGRVLWRREVPMPSGRGLVDGDSVWLPVGDRLDRFALKDGTPMASMRVGTDGRAPLGNLMTDGERIYAAGLGYLAAIRDTKLVARARTAAVREDPDPQALLERGVFRTRVRQYADAVADLTRAHEAATGGKAALKTAVRRALMQALRGAVGAAVGDVDDHLRMLRGLATSPSELREVLHAEMRYYAGRGDAAAAVDACFALLDAAGDKRSLGLADSNQPEWQVSSEVWVRLRLTELLDEGGDDVRAVVESAVTDRIDATTSESERPAIELYRLMVASPPVEAAARAGLSAALHEERHGDPIRAELMYMRMRDASEPRLRAAGLAGLAWFCERRQWPSYAYRTWQQLERLRDVAPQTLTAAEQTSQTEPPADRVELAFETVDTGELARKARDRIEASAGDRLSPSPVAPVPPPPYRLAWRREGRVMPVTRQLDWPVRSRFTDEHLLVTDLKKSHLRCIDLKANEDLWSISCKGYAKLFRGHAVFRDDPKAGAFSLLTGEPIWETERKLHLSIVGMHAPYAMGRAVLLAQPAGAPNSRMGIDTVTGDALWSRRTLLEMDAYPQPEHVVLMTTVERIQNSMEVPFTVFDRRTGRRLNPNLRLNWNIYYPQRTSHGFVTVSGRELILQRYTDGATGWSVPLRGDPILSETHTATRLEYFPQEACVVVQDTLALTCVDLASGEPRWSVPLVELASDTEQYPQRHAWRFIYDAVNRDMLLVLMEGRRNGENESMSYFAVDMVSGEVTVAIRPKPGRYYRYENYVPTSREHLLIECRERRTDGEARPSRSRYAAFVARDSGEPLPPSTFPGGNTNPLVVGEYVVSFEGRNGLAVYEHDPEEKEP